MFSILCIGPVLCFISRLFGISSVVVSIIWYYKLSVQLGGDMRLSNINFIPVNVFHCLARMLIAVVIMGS